jgi:predicted ATPase/DNA-binding winged helix-turn-helix (wHTH) protein/tetratricopeptide (TPR) repeat protein
MPALILIVDSNLPRRIAVTRYLESSGWRVQGLAGHEDIPNTARGVAALVVDGALDNLETWRQWFLADAAFAGMVVMGAIEPVAPGTGLASSGDPADVEANLQRLVSQRQPVFPIPLGRVDVDRRVVERPDGVKSLTEMEARFFGYLARRAGQTVPRDELLQRVWGYHKSVSSRTIDSTAYRLRKKVERNPAEPEVLLTAVGSGYRMPSLVTTPQPAPPPAFSPRRDSFHGRETELEQLSQWKADGARLITIQGTAGIGKTRLAAEYSHLVNRANGRIVWVALDQTANLAAFLGAVEHALGHADQPVAPVLGSMGPALLVLDNLEQLVDDCAVTVAEWLDHCPEVTVLATSRRPLAVAGEHLLALAPLPVEAAAELFRRRASAMQPTATLDPAIVHSVAQQLDCMPLSLELGASRMRAMSIQTLDQQLRDALLDTVKNRRRDSPARHHSVRASLQWSWDLLTADERQVLGACCGFEGPFDLPMARAVTEQRDVLDPLESLYDHGLLRTCEPIPSDVRYRAPRCVREFANEQLTHTQQMTRFEGVVGWALGLDTGSEPSELHTLDNDPLVPSTAELIRIAEALVERGNVESAAKVFRVSWRGRPTYGLRVFVPLARRLVQHLATLSDSCGYFVARANAVIERLYGEPQLAPAYAEEALTRARRLKEPERICAALVLVARYVKPMDRTPDNRGPESKDPILEALALTTNPVQRVELLWLQGRHSGNLEQVLRGLEEAHAMGDRLQEARAHQAAGELLVGSGRFSDAATHLELAIGHFDGMGKHQLLRGVATENLAFCRRELGDPETAVSLFREALQRLVGSYFLAADTHFELAKTLIELKRVVEAKTHLEQALRLARLGRAEQLLTDVQTLMDSL